MFAVSTGVQLSIKDMNNTKPWPNKVFCSNEYSYSLSHEALVNAT